MHEHLNALVAYKQHLPLVERHGSTRHVTMGDAATRCFQADDRQPAGDDARRSESPQHVINVGLQS